MHLQKLDESKPASRYSKKGCVIDKNPIEEFNPDLVDWDDLIRQETLITSCIH
jgi:hypothetical protein